MWPQTLESWLPSSVLLRHKGGGFLSYSLGKLGKQFFLKVWSVDTPIRVMWERWLVKNVSSRLFPRLTRSGTLDDSVSLRSLVGDLDGQRGLRIHY